MDTSRRTTYSTFLLRTFDDLRKFDPNFRERIVDNSRGKYSTIRSPNRIQNNDVADRAGRGKKTKKRNKEREREKKTVFSSTQGREGRNAARGPMVSRLGKRKKKRVERNASRLIASGRYLATVASIRNSNLIIPWMQLGAG